MTTETVFTHARVKPDGALVDILVRGGVIVAVGTHLRGGSPRDLGGAVVVPGFVDMHNHGGGGAAIYTGRRADVIAAADFQLHRGTTAMLASVATMPLEQMEAAAAAIAAAIDEGSAPNIRGIHFEGPFLSPHKAGAQASSALLQPSEETYQRLAAAAGGHLVQMTVAPELPGCLELIRRHRDEVIFALGHSAATAGDAARAFGAGVRQVTHLFNALPRFEPRLPGAAVRALLDERVTLEVIGDGIHLADDTLRLVFAAAARRVAIVTDSNATAGMQAGQHTYADRVVDVDRHGRATVTGTHTLAGSTMPLGAVFARLVNEVGLPFDTVVRATSSTAAHHLGMPHPGCVEPGARADLVLLDDDLRVSGVVLNGRLVSEC